MFYFLARLHDNPIKEKELAEKVGKHAVKG